MSHQQVLGFEFLNLGVFGNVDQAARWDFVFEVLKFLVDLISGVLVCLGGLAGLGVVVLVCLVALRLNRFEFRLELLGDGDLSSMLRVRPPALNILVRLM